MFPLLCYFNIVVLIELMLIIITIIINYCNIYNVFKFLITVILSTLVLTRKYYFYLYYNKNIDL